MLKQWHQELSHAKITFHLFDTWRRHTSAQVVNRRVKNTPDSLKQFGELIHNDSFQSKLLLAQRNPTGPEAKEVLVTVQSILSSDATKVPYSPSERAHAAVEIVNMIREYGPPSFFITYSPDDSSNPHCIATFYRANRQ